MQILILIFGVAVYLAFAPASSAAERAQPLTRADCEEAGKAWNETANVCGEKTIESKNEKTKKGGKHKKDQSRLKEEPPEADSR
jgi:hypothetical protein